MPRPSRLLAAAVVLGAGAAWVRRVVLPARPDDARLPIPRRIPDPDARIWLAGAYLLIAIAILIAQRREIIRIARCAFKIGAERDDYQRAGPSRSAP